MRFLPLAILLAAPLQAQGLDIGIVGATDAASLADVAATLSADARIGAATTYDASTMTPDLATLQSHDGVVVFLNYPFAYLDPNTLGDNLAAYAAGGGGVVECMRSGSGPNTLGGAWASTYQISNPWTFVTFIGTYHLGTVLNPGHPIMAGVSTVSTGTGGWHSFSLGANASIIAEWDTGNPMVAEHISYPNVAYFNGIPVSAGVNNAGIDPLTDAPLMLANIVAYASPTPPPVGPTLSIAANCGGVSTVSLSNMTPNGRVYLGWSFSQGAGVVPGGSCAGTPISLTNVTLLTQLTADGSGDASMAANTPAGACGTVHVLAFDAGSCTESNVVSL